MRLILHLVIATQGDEQRAVAAEGAAADVPLVEGHVSCCVVRVLRTKTQRVLGEAISERVYALNSGRAREEEKALRIKATD